MEEQGTAFSTNKAEIANELGMLKEPIFGINPIC